MNYRKDKYGNDLSILGFGCMRFQRKMGQIDMEKTENQILLAIEQGIAIRQELKNARQVLETPAYKVLRKALSVFTKF